MESSVGIKGFNAYRTVEEYKSEKGEKMREYKAEIRILGIPIQYEGGTINHEKLESESNELEKLLD